MIFRALLTIQVLLTATYLHAESLKLAVTTSFHNSGLSEVLLPEIKIDLNLDVHLLVVGTGQALRLGQAGDVDALLVHSKSSEEEFINAGFGTHRTEIMYNDFVLVGPSEDPAQISSSPTAAAALKQIENKQIEFVSRGDDSGTHKKERSLWMSSGLDPENFSSDWYREAGSGMGASLNVASGMNAYILTDRASWLKFGNKGNLKLLFSGDPGLFNMYAFLPVNPVRHEHVKADFVLRLEQWLKSDRAKALISGYTLHGERLFTPVTN